MVKFLAEWFTAGGPFMWAILAVLAFSCAVFAERFFFYYLVCGRRGNQIVSKLAGYLNENKSGEADKLLKRGNAPLLVLLRTALDRFSSGVTADEVQEGVEETAIIQVPRLSQRLNYLSLFANIATLLGLLGTITGLQLSFSSLATVDAAQKASLLASGISQAMITTAFGLIVAIPCMVAYTFLVNKQNQLTKDLDQSVVKFLNYLKKKSS